jgi:hypothetical protein
MEMRAGEIAVHYVEHGAGRPVLVLHGAGVDHREAEACRSPTGLSTSSSVTRLAPTTRRRWPRGRRVVVGSGELGDDDFRSYFVVQNPEMLERYEGYVLPAAALVDQAALERIGERWEVARDQGQAYAGPTLVVADGWTRRSGMRPLPTSWATTRTPRSR